MRLLGIDIGGTFTDLVYLDTESGELRTHKLLTTPDDPVRAVIQGAGEIIGSGPFPDRVVHGTTLVTNAVVERKGAVTGLLTTRGFRDVLEIRREGRYDLYDLDLEFPEPLVPRYLRFEIDERMDETGRVLDPLNVETLQATLDGMQGLGVESLAVCLLHGYANPEHEHRVRDAVMERFPDLPISLAGDLAPEIREYERTSTTVANAYVRPVAEGYLHRLADGLKELAVGRAGGEPVLHIMLSDGGITHPETAAEQPIRIVESGPAGGVIAAERIGRGLDDPKLLSLDMGGTTAKIAFLDGDGPRTRSVFEVDRRHLYKKGSGLPLLVPSLDLVEIGAGGGSLARRGSLGTLEVGPESAGADPGPACYGKGTGATVTDADLVLGLLNPDYFLGGAMKLDRSAAEAAIENHVAGPLGLSLMEAAHGVHTLVGSSMAEAARVHAAERGLDMAGHTLVAFGGAGPVHAWSVARQLRIPRVVFPGHAGVESALGFLAAAPAFEIARSWTASLETLDEPTARSMLEGLAGRARTVVAAAGPGEPSVQVSVDMRYRGQGTEVRVPVTGLEVNRTDLAEAFARRYEALYGRSVTDVPVEAVTWRVRCSHAAPPIAVFDQSGDEPPDRDAPHAIATRTAWLPDGEAPEETPVYRRTDFEPGMVIAGPALVEEAECTLVLGRGTARVLPGGTILAEVAP